MWRSKEKKKWRNNRRDNNRLCLRLCKCSRLCVSSVSLVLTCFSLVSEWKGGGIHFKAEARRMSVQLQKYETSMSMTMTNLTNLWPSSGQTCHFHLFGHLVLCFGKSTNTKGSCDVQLRGKWRAKAETSGANHKAPRWLSGIRSVTGAETQGGQFVAWLNEMQLCDAQLAALLPLQHLMSWMIVKQVFFFFFFFFFSSFYL